MKYESKYRIHKTIVFGQDLQNMEFTEGIETHRFLTEAANIDDALHAFQKKVSDVWEAYANEISTGQRRIFFDIEVCDRLHPVKGEF